MSRFLLQKATPKAFIALLLVFLLSLLSGCGGGSASSNGNNASVTINIGSSQNVVSVNSGQWLLNQIITQAYAASLLTEYSYLSRITLEIWEGDNNITGQINERYNKGTFGALVAAEGNDALLLLDTSTRISVPADVALRYVVKAFQTVDGELVRFFQTEASYTAGLDSADFSGNLNMSLRVNINDSMIQQMDTPSLPCVDEDIDPITNAVVGDGICDTYENLFVVIDTRTGSVTEGQYIPDVDLDGIPNGIDTDSDGDGVDDANEDASQNSNNGYPNFVHTNNNPTSTRAEITLAQGATQTFSPDVDDDDEGDTFTVISVIQPLLGAVSIVGGALHYEAPRDQSGDTQFSYTVVDYAAQTPISGIALIHITAATPPNSAPDVYSLASLETNEDTAISNIDVVSETDAQDPDGDNISVTAFDTVSNWGGVVTQNLDGTLNYTPAANYNGSDSFAFTISDDFGGSIAGVFGFDVLAVNDAPVISGAPVITVEENSTYSFMPTANDVDAGDILVFSLTNQPAWASFNTITGELSGIPARDDAGVTLNIVITVTDNEGLTDSLPAFDLTVTTNNVPPVYQSQIYEHFSGGENHTLALRSDGTVWAWGGNNYGQLGNGDFGGGSTPVQALGLSNIIDLAAGDFHSVALRSDRTVWLWGHNNNGQLGKDSAEHESSIPSQLVGLTAVDAVAAGRQYTVALKTDGTVWSWGRNSYGQLGNDSTTSTEIPQQAVGLSNIIAISAGRYHALALKGDGTVWAWGRNNYGQLGDGSDTQRTIPVQVSGLTGVVSIASGGSHNIAMKSDGTLWLWGWNLYGQLGDGTMTDSAIPVQIAGLTGVDSMAAGRYHTLVSRSDGTVWSWGRNLEGQLGGNTTSGSTSPVLMTSLSDITAVSAGYKHSLARASDNTLWAWGRNGYGQLGDGADLVLTTPRTMSEIRSVLAITAGRKHSAAILDDGRVWSWGDGDDGELGNAATVDVSVPVPVAGLKSVRQVTLGIGFSVALKEDGTVWSWGSNGYGRLGDGTTNDSSVPVQVSSLSDVSDISAGRYHVLALMSDGSVQSWGRNSDGQLGDGSNTHRHTPVQVGGLSGVIAIAAGGYHSFALRNDGTVWAWGRNTNGQLGDNSFVDSAVPVQVSGLSAITAIAGGGYHGFALKDDDSLWVWGRNDRGQVGNGSLSDLATPVSILTNVADFSAGDYHSLAIRNDGTLWSWGWNDNGQLGNGDTFNSSTPVQMQNAGNVIAIAAGYYHSMMLRTDGTVATWGYDNNGQLGTGRSLISTVPLRVADGVSLHAWEDVSATTIDVLGYFTDADGDLPSVISVDANSAEGGSVIDNNDGSFNYTPAPGFNGIDFFAYTVSDGVESVSVTVTVNVGSVNDRPLAVDDSYTFSIGDTALMVVANSGVLSNDSDSDFDAMTVMVDTLPANGTLVLNIDGSFVYTPTGALTTDSFTYMVSDGQGGVDTGLVSISADWITSIQYFNFSDLSAFTLNGQASTLNPVAGESVLRLTATGIGGGGSVFLNQTIPLQDNSGFNASFSSFFKFRISNPAGISDSDGQGADGLVFVVQTAADSVGGLGGGIGYSGINNSVGVEIDTYNNGGGDGNSGNHVGINTNGNLSSIALAPYPDRFNDGDTFFAWVDYQGSSQNLEVRISADGVRPALAMVSATIDLVTTLGVSDAYIGFTSGSAAATNNHDILAWEFVNAYAPIQAMGTAPVAVDDAEVTGQDIILVTGNVLLNDTDVDDDVLSVSNYQTTSAQGGTVVDNGDGTFAYMPPPGFLGVDNFEYTVTDDFGGFDVGVVGINVM
ncbi:MAG: tandem-95 repeat protein [Gammaproteobacteria bacterium]|nr:tandem-95 repeat protein [Gammaproteobacteria bacterium]